MSGGGSTQDAGAIPIYQVDAFTAEPFRGNPAAVCLLNAPRLNAPRAARDAEWMQAIARDMNLSETAFLTPDGDGSGAYELRWFTPAIEVPLCGHATLASAHVLFEAGLLEPDQPARFRTRHSGELVARRADDRAGAGAGAGDRFCAGDRWIEMDFPALRVADATAPREVLDALAGAEPRRVTVLPRETYGKDAYLVELQSERAVRELRPQLDAIRGERAPALIVTARADRAGSGSGGSGVDGVDFVSRFFAPCVGVDEDPVTGSAHCALATYWGAALGRNELIGYQASPRGGVVGVRWDGDRVTLRGQAVTVLRGTLMV